MRQILLSIPAFFLAGTAAAQSLQVEPGLWRTTTDVYFEGVVDGEDISEAPSSDELTECWLTEEEITLDPSILSGIEGCELGDVTWTAFGMSAPLICTAEGLSMDGYVDFAVSYDKQSFTGRMNLVGWNDTASVVTDGVLISHRVGACPSN